ncbi:hypothetical protein NG798_20915 [Ancylothrix sp. C2]|nr:hypothetical protein [Ancylothrix sp. D3o]
MTMPLESCLSLVVAVGLHGHHNSDGFEFAECLSREASRLTTEVLINSLSQSMRFGSGF